MPKFDFQNEQFPKRLEIPIEPIKLVENMEIEEVRTYIFQKLKNIYKSEENYLYKEMAKEDLYDELVEKSYNPDKIMIC